MGTFFKTFFICLVCAISFFVYKYVSTESYENNLAVSENSPIFGLHENNNDLNSNDDVSKEEIKEKNNEKVNEELPVVKNEVKKYTHTCYFYSQSGKLVPFHRELVSKPSLKTTIQILLKGPTIAETKKGIYSEIPANVDLISVKSTEKGIIVDLTSNFGNGGGTQSVENRVKQLSKTIKSFTPNKNIYLYINGKEVEYLGGEGLYIKQPL